MLASRSDAGRTLGEQLRADRETVVIAMSAGGVAVAVPIAYALGAHLEIAPAADLDPLAHNLPVPVAARRAIIVDDGTASLHALLVAVLDARRRAAGPVWLAAPVVRLAAAQTLRSVFDEVHCLAYIADATAPASCYRDAESELHVLLRRALEAGLTAHGMPPQQHAAHRVPAREPASRT